MGGLGDGEIGSLVSKIQGYSRIGWLQYFLPLQLQFLQKDEIGEVGQEGNWARGKGNKRNPKGIGKDSP